jgi:hypothetical protein
VPLTPPCPKCGKGAPVRLMFWGAGKPYKCDGCSAELVIPKNFWIPFAAIMIFSAFKSQNDDPASLGILFVGLCVLMLLAQRFLIAPEVCDAKP